MNNSNARLSIPQAIKMTARRTSGKVGLLHFALKNQRQWYHQNQFSLKRTSYIIHNTTVLASLLFN